MSAVTSGAEAHFRGIIGPVVEIEPPALSAAANLRYSGRSGYRHLLACLRGFDVALMPLALKEATLSTSPAKTSSEWRRA